MWKVAMKALVLSFFLGVCLTVVVFRVFSPSASLLQFQMQHEDSIDEDAFNLFRDNELIASFLIEKDGQLSVASIHDTKNDAVLYYRFDGPGVTIDDGLSEFVYLKKDFKPSYKIAKESGDIFELIEWSYQEVLRSQAE
jgi:hypothetical protein